MKTTIKLSMIFKAISLLIILYIFTSCEKDDYYYICNDDIVTEKVIKDKATIVEKPGCHSTETFVIDFEEFKPGDIIDTSKGVKFYATDHKNSSGNRFMAFDSDAEVASGQDRDLLTGSGNIGIISEDLDSGDPDDNSKGGTIRIHFKTVGQTNSIRFFYIIDNQKKGGYYIVFTEGSKPAKRPLPVTKNKESLAVAVNASNVSRIDVVLKGSGAIDNIIGSITKTNCL